MKKAVLAAGVGALLGVVAAVAISEGAGMASFDPGLARLGGGIAFVTAVGAAQGLLASRWWGPTGRQPATLVFVGGTWAAFCGLVLARTWTAWTDLSVFGAGPGGRLALLALPLSQALAGAVLGSLADAERERALREGP